MANNIQFDLGGLIDMFRGIGQLNEQKKRREESRNLRNINFYTQQLGNVSDLYKSGLIPKDTLNSIMKSTSQATGVFPDMVRNTEQETQQNIPQVNNYQDTLGFTEALKNAISGPQQPIYKEPYFSQEYDKSGNIDDVTARTLLSNVPNDVQFNDNTPKWMLPYGTQYKDESGNDVIGIPSQYKRNIAMQNLDIKRQSAESTRYRDVVNGMLRLLTQGYTPQEGLGIVQNTSSGNMQSLPAQQSPAFGLKQQESANKDKMVNARLSLIESQKQINNAKIAAQSIRSQGGGDYNKISATMLGKLSKIQELTMNNAFALMKKLQTDYSNGLIDKDTFDTNYAQAYRDAQQAQQEVLDIANRGSNQQIKQQSAPNPNYNRTTVKPMSFSEWKKTRK